MLVRTPAALGGAEPLTQQLHRTRNNGGGETGGLHSLVPFMVPPGCRTRNFSALSGILALAILAQEAVDHVVVVEDLAPVPNLQRQ